MITVKVTSLLHQSFVIIFSITLLLLLLKIFELKGKDEVMN